MIMPFKDDGIRFSHVCHRGWSEGLAGTEFHAYTENLRVQEIDTLKEEAERAQEQLLAAQQVL